MLSSLLTELKHPLPADESGNRPKIDLETAYTIFALFFYTGPLIQLVFGQSIANKVTQPGFLLLYAINGYLMFRYRDRIAPVLKRSGLLWLVILLPLLSTIWSPFPDVTLRRAFGLVNTSLFGMYLGTRYTYKEALFLLRYTFLIILALTLVFTVAMPSLAFHQELHAGALRGVFVHKNGTAARLAMGFLVFLVFSLDRLSGFPPLDIAGTLISFVLIVMTQSTTGLGGCLLALMALPFLFIPRGKVSLILPMVFGSSLILMLSLLFVTENLDAVLGAFGEDGGLTGRGNFWPVIIDSIYQRFWIGYGYEAFWSGGLNGPGAILTQLASTNTKAHAHNGFLETLLSVGFLGFTVFLFNLWSALLQFLAEIRSTSGYIYFFPFLFIVQFLAMNMVETSIYSFNSLAWVLYTFVMIFAVKAGMRQATSAKLARAMGAS